MEEGPSGSGLVKWLNEEGTKSGVDSEREKVEDCVGRPRCSKVASGSTCKVNARPPK
jgi:hypothetical protein